MSGRKGQVLSTLVLVITSFVIFNIFYGANSTAMIPLDNEGLYKNEMFWGSYRPSVYFGMKTRSTHPITTGLSWTSPTNLKHFRHTCEQGDNLQKYGWIAHDGVNFGEQIIRDTMYNIQLETSFLKHDPQTQGGGSWSNVFRGAPIKGTDIGYWIYYITFPEDCKIISKPKPIRKGVDEIKIMGNCKETGDFTFIIKQTEGKVPEVNGGFNLPDFSKFFFNGYTHLESDQWKVIESVKQELYNSYTKTIQKFQADGREINKQNVPIVVPVLSNSIEKDANTFVFLKVVELPYQIEVAWIAHESSNNYGYALSPLKKSEISLPDGLVNQFFGDDLKSQLSFAKSNFNNKMDRIFLLKDAEGITMNVDNAAYYAFSNLIGGMGYWEGDSLIYEGKNEKGQVMTSEMIGGKLFSAVPSRPFFPRGFLWDEGFHQLLISDWNPKITIDVLSHWLNLMHESGWIPREQILGAEARSKVPAEYQPQHRDHANPPTFFLVVEKLIRKSFLSLQKTINSLPSSNHNNNNNIGGQRQEMEIVSGDFTMHKLKTEYPSLLDEFGGMGNMNDIFQFLTNSFERLEKWFRWFETEQASHVPNAFRWRGRLENHTLSSGLDDYPRARYPSDKELHLDLICWLAYSAKVLASISTFTRGNEGVYLEKYHAYVKTLEELHWDASQNIYADISKYTEGTPTVFVKHIGYVTLFPLITGLISPSSPRLKAILDVIEDEKKLWTAYGLRSLSLSDPYYKKGENYWTGPIWININYMVLSSLHRNYLGEGPHQEQATSIYKRLRKNIVTNMVRVYERTGYIWEQYNQDNGDGNRSHPFTGWSALLVSMIAEKY